MANRLIFADDMISYLEHRRESLARSNYSTLDAKFEIAEAIGYVNRTDTVDAEPIKYGYWIRYPDCGVTVCSECRWTIEQAWDSKRCPECGTHMEPEE